MIDLFGAVFICLVWLSNCPSVLDQFRLALRLLILSKDSNTLSLFPLSPCRTDFIFSFSSSYKWMCTHILYLVTFVKFHSFLQAVVSFTFTRLSHSISRIHWLLCKRLQENIHYGQNLSINFVLWEFGKHRNTQLSYRNTNIAWELVTISLNITDGCLLMALSIDWSIPYELVMNFQRAAVLRSHTVLRCKRWDFCHFISGTILIVYECVERHSFY